MASTSTWDRLAGKFAVQPNGCWLVHDPRYDGYKNIWYEGENRLLHAVIYTVMAGHRRSGAVCTDKSCVNPFHVARVTDA